MADRFDRSFPDIALVLTSHVAERQGLEAQARLVNDAIDFANYPLTRRSSKKRILGELGWEGDDADRRLLLAARLATATFDRIGQIEIEKGIEKPERKKRKAGRRAIVAATQSTTLVEDTPLSDERDGMIESVPGRYKFKATMQEVPIEVPVYPALPGYSETIVQPRSPAKRTEREDPDEKPEEIPRAYLTDDTVGDYLRHIGQTPLLNAEQEVILAKQIEAGLYAEQLLSGDETMGADLAKMNISEDELRRIAGEGVAAKRHMIKANLRLAVNLVRKHSHQEMPFGDLVSEANLGLARAVGKFDFAKGFKFSTYATWWIRQAISRASVGTGTMIRLPVHQGEHLRSLVQAKRSYIATNDREPSIEELAKECGVSVEEATLLLQYEKPVLSLDSPITNDNDPEGATLGDFYAKTEDTTDGIVEGLVDNANIRRLHQFIKRLPEAEATVLRLRYGLDSGAPLKLIEVGNAIGGVTPQRARQIEKKAIERLRLMAAGSKADE